MWWDKKDNWDKKRVAQKNFHLNDLQKTVRSCGISFEIWDKTNADGKGSGQYDFTSLLGSDKKKLQKKIYPASFLVLSSQRLQKLFKNFDALYSIFVSKEPSNEDMASYFARAKGWVNLFASLQDKRIGYKRANVTPYMHAVVYHIPTFF